MKRWILRLRLYRFAAWLYETYRLIAKPSTQGALVALWHQQQVLLVQASYRHELSLPGGWISRGETARMAAQRELAEELCLHLQDCELGEPWAFTERSVRGINTVTIFSVGLAKRPVVQVDGLEILDCLWLSRTDALNYPITEHLRAYLLQRPKC